MKKLIVAEVFNSIQGEGQTMGVPSVFLRLGGCNLLCKSETWICDSIEVWQKGKAIPFPEIFDTENLNKLRDGFHLIITGGEPLIHDSALIDFLNWFSETNGFLPTIEIETNGTILPSFDLTDLIYYWNVSPKLKNSGEPYAKRMNEIALDRLKQLGERTIFKFVVTNQMDILEMLEEYGSFINMNQIVLMAAGSNREELDKVRKTVAEICIQFNFRYSERLHIVIWNQKTGV